MWFAIFLIMWLFVRWSRSIVFFLWSPTTFAFCLGFRHKLCILRECCDAGDVDRCWRRSS